ncbi:MAG: beta-propeller fold lactonase family protein [Pseudomonadota bacterium]
MSNPFFYYASVGASLSTYAVDFATAELRRTASITLSASVQYIWPHPRRPIIYATLSNGGPGLIKGTHHVAVALSVDRDSGALTELGPPIALPTRPIHCTVDHHGHYLLIAYNHPSTVTVHRLGGDGTLGETIAQSTLDAGIFAHQVRMLPSNRTALVVARGNDATDTQPEDPGALKVFDFAAGVLSSRTTVAPGDGYGFGPRHLDIHPNGKWLYVSIERQDELHHFEIGPNDDIATAPRAVVSSLESPDRRQGPQMASAVHVHPNGRFVYQANRTEGRRTLDDGWMVAHRGENNVVVHQLDADTGEPHPIQHIDVPSIHPRTFSIDPTGQLLAVSTIQPVPRESDSGVVLVPAAISLYRVGGDGRLSLARSYQVDTQGDLLFWSGFIAPSHSAV